MNNDILSKLAVIANIKFDGHLTIMKFTTNWRVDFGTLYDRGDINAMPAGKTFHEAVANALADLILSESSEQEGEEETEFTFKDDEGLELLHYNTPTCEELGILAELRMIERDCFSE